MIEPAEQRPTRGVWLNWPNRITIARIMLVGPFVICLLNLNDTWPVCRPLAIGLLAVMAVSDALDGFLARRLRAQTPLGRYLDPIGDKLLVTSAVVLLAVDATAIPHFRLPSWVPVIAIGKDLLTVIGFGLVYATTGQFFIQPRVWGKACTVLQLLLVAYVLIAPSLPSAWPSLVVWFSAFASGMAVIALADYIRIGNRFASEQHAKTRKAGAS